MQRTETNFFPIAQIQTRLEETGVVWIVIHGFYIKEIVYDDEFHGFASRCH